MISKIFLQQDDWLEESSSCNSSKEDFEILRWAGNKSLSVRSNLAYEFFQITSPSCVIDLGCGTGQLLYKLIPLGSIDKLVGVEISPLAFNRLKVRCNGSRFELHNLGILEYLSLISSSPDLLFNSCGVALIGVLQNCMHDPFDLLNQIIEVLKPSCLFLTTKSTSSKVELDQFDPLLVGHSLFFTPELLNFFSSRGYSAIVREIVIVPSSRNFNICFMLKRDL